jgi:uncharacterized membrane protein YkvA (DUF1232 family)
MLVIVKTTSLAPAASRPRSRGFSIVPFFGDLLVMLRLLRDRDAGWGLKLVSLLTLLYVVSPIDAIPEALMPLVAWIDDVGLVLTLRLALESKLARYRYPLFESPAVEAPIEVRPTQGPVKS